MLAVQFSQIYTASLKSHEFFLFGYICSLARKVRFFFLKKEKKCKTLKGKEKIAEKTKDNKSNDPVDRINVDYHHVHVKPPSSAIILKVQVIHPVCSMREMPSCKGICAPLKACRSNVTVQSEFCLKGSNFVHILS